MAQVELPFICATSEKANKGEMKMNETDRKSALAAYEKAAAAPKGKRAVQEFHNTRAALRKVNRELGTGKYAK